MLVFFIFCFLYFSIASNAECIRAPSVRAPFAASPASNLWPLVGQKNVSCFESLALVGREKTSPAATNMPISTASAYHSKYKVRGRSINMKQILFFKICQFVTCPALSSQFPLPGDQFFQGNYFFCFLGVLEEPGTCVALLHAST